MLLQTENTLVPDECYSVFVASFSFPIFAGYWGITHSHGYYFLINHAHQSIE